jgi:hypothetical protein
MISHGFVSPITSLGVSSLSNTYMAGTALFVVSADDMILAEILIGHKPKRTHARRAVETRLLQPSSHVQELQFRLSEIDKLELLPQGSTQLA